jgi:hypothetical protein
MATTLLYSDTLVEITDDAICFKDYYFPVGSKSVRFSDIERIMAVKPNWHNGQYRIQGTGDLQTWFPRDWHRPSRSELFFVYLRGSSRRIGFTVEAADQVETILRDKHLLSGSAGL